MDVATQSRVALNKCFSQQSNFLWFTQRIIFIIAINPSGGWENVPINPSGGWENVPVTLPSH